jgi:glutamine cyclotransferase
MNGRLLKLSIMVWLFLPGVLFARDLPTYIKTTKLPIQSIDVINVYPHDIDAFTQGLFIHGGFLYEATGQYGKSGLYKKEIETGRVLQAYFIGEKYFGEGVTVLKDRIYQLTWQDETMIVYDLKSLQVKRKVKYRGEGWGLTTDGRRLWMSNGTSTLFARDPDTFKITRKIDVKDGRTSIERLNELEVVRGEIWANIYLDDFIARICPGNGKVKGWIDLTSLRSYLTRDAQVDVINGIAYDRKADRVFLTGKYWPYLFEIKVKSHQ